MKEIARIGGINILILIVYTILIHFSASNVSKAAEIMFNMVAAIFSHIIACFVMGAIYFGRKKMEVGKAWQVSAGIVLLIGFSACLGSLNL